MNIILVLIVWLSVAIVVGISFGKFCAAGSGRDAKIPRKMSMESETSANNVRRLEAA
jgi:hypothetical protein